MAEWWRRRRWLGVGLIAGLVAGLLSACSGDGPSPDPAASPSPSPSPSPWGPELSYEQAYQQIPTEGTAEKPLVWRLPEVEDADLAAALRVSRLTMALDHYRASMVEPSEYSHLYRYLMTERMLDVQFPDGPHTGYRNDPPNSGPVWIWVLEVVGAPQSQARVSYCVDYGWSGRPGVDTLPRVDRAGLESHELVWEEGADGEFRWVVDGIRNQDPALGPEYREECDAWASHAPDDLD